LSSEEGNGGDEEVFALGFVDETKENDEIFVSKTRRLECDRKEEDEEELFSGGGRRRGRETCLNEKKDVERLLIRRRSD
jgi:hypothetical protein